MTLSQGGPRVSTRKKGSLGVANRSPLGVDLSLGSPRLRHMPDRVAIVGVGQTTFRATSPGLSYKEIMFEAATLEGLLRVCRGRRAFGADVYDVCFLLAHDLLLA